MSGTQPTLEPMVEGPRHTILNHKEMDLNLTPSHGRGRNPCHRCNNWNPQEDPDDPLLKLLKVEAPSFDGSHNPSAYLEWETSMDRYFDWYPMSEARKVRFAKMRLTNLAKTVTT